MRYVRLNTYWRMMAPAILTCEGDTDKEKEAYARSPGLRAIRKAWEECHTAIHVVEANTAVKALNEVLVSAAVIEGALARSVP